MRDTRAAEGGAVRLWCDGRGRDTVRPSPPEPDKARNPAIFATGGAR